MLKLSPGGGLNLRSHGMGVMCMFRVRGLVTRVEERRVRGTAEVSVARRGDRGGETLDLISRYVYVIGATFHHAWEDFKRRLRNVATRSDDRGGTLESLQQTNIGNAAGRCAERSC